MKFTQPVSMQCSQEQFERDLKEPLEKLGYKQKSPLILDGEDYLTTNYAYNNDYFTFLKHNFIKDNGRHFINHYNPQLFIALASMSNEPNGIVGEWFRSAMYCDSLLKMKRDNSQSFKSSNGWRKPTKEELIAHFTKKECKEQESTMEKFNILSDINIKLNDLLYLNKKVAHLPEGVEMYHKICQIKNLLPINQIKDKDVPYLEHQKMISTYESRIKELEEKNNALSRSNFDLRELIDKIKHLL